MRLDGVVKSFGSAEEYLAGQDPAIRVLPPVLCTRLYFLLRFRNKW